MFGKSGADKRPCGAVFAQQNGQKRTQQNTHVQHEAAPPDISDVVQNAFFPRMRCAAVDLGESGQSGLDIHPLVTKRVVRFHLIG